jgi:large-conductance mechanosensitive channel
MGNSNEAIIIDSNHIKTKVVITVLLIIGFFIVGFYFLHFHSGFSKDNGVWGTFGDYVGGILNPIIAAFAFYLIAKTYELQQKELKELTDAQKKQITLAALTALLNSNLTRIGMLESEKFSLLNGKVPEPEGHASQSNEDSPEFLNGVREVLESNSPMARKAYRIRDIVNEINSLTEKNNSLTKQIEDFFEEN